MTRTVCVVVIVTVVVVARQVGGVPEKTSPCVQRYSCGCPVYPKAHETVQVSPGKRPRQAVISAVFGRMGAGQLPGSTV